MSKLVTFFLVMLVGCSILGAIMKGGGGIVAEPLTLDVTESGAILTMASTTEYLAQDYVVIGEEKILYTGKTSTTLTGATRGYDGTDAIPHYDGDMVYTADASSINNALGFNIAAVQDSMGWWGTITIPFRFLFQTLPRIARMNMSFLTGSLAIIGWIWFAMAAGFFITLALSLAGARRV